MDIPWLQLSKYQDQDGLTGPGFSDYVWQALFACQIGILPHQEWVKLKWGFNASALFDEAMDRQRLFLESQHRVWNEIGTEMPDHRSLAMRLIKHPADSLMITLVGKIHGHTDAEAQQKALAFLREIESTFPYDYTLQPARTQDEFLQFSGSDILQADRDDTAVVQIKRVEIPMRQNRNAPVLHGLWQSSPRAHEQIWRSVALSPVPVVLTIALRPTVIYGKEREHLLKCADEITNISPDESLNPRTLSIIQNWNKSYAERRLDPWKKFFYLQVFVATRGPMDENLLRIIGNTLVLSKDGQPAPGYQIATPKFGEKDVWLRKLENLDVLFSGSILPVPRLSEVADLEEVFAVMRIPYSPPENGFPNLNFALPATMQG
jgi:hypothetical protein